MSPDPVLSPRGSGWEGAGTFNPATVTPHGIVLYYNGADDQLTYRTAVAIFDHADPRRVIYRGDEPIFEPERDWEKIGQVPNVVFVEGMAQRDGRQFFYYGAADKYVGVAEAIQSNGNSER